MKNYYYYLFALILCSCVSLKPSQKGTFVDQRDGHEYKWVQLGNQTWMAQNLDFVCGNSWYYNNDSTNHKFYGRYYNCETAKVVCPPGWHLPSDNEWKTLEKAVGMQYYDADMRMFRGFVAKKFVGKKGKTEFNVLFLGRYAQGKVDKFGEHAQFWTSTKDGIPTFTRLFVKGDERIGRTSIGSAYGCNVRCIKDNDIH